MGRFPTMRLLTRLADVLRQRQRGLLIALLLVLHVALFIGTETPMGRLCWLVDVGLFILWQPFTYAERRVDPVALTVIALVLGAGLAWYGWWLLNVWVTIVAALVGGRVMFIDHRPTRMFYLLAFAYLLTALLLLLIPRVVPPSALSGPQLDREFLWGMPLLFVIMALLPRSSKDDRSERPGDGMIDLFYSLFIFLLIAVLFLGSLAFMLLRQTDYFVALLDTLLTMAVLLLLIGWTWNTRPCFTGIDVIFSRYLLTIGLPFEQWLHRLTTLATKESDPEKFLSQSLQEMLTLPWVDGGNWHVGTRQGSFGENSRFRQDFPGEPLHLVLHTRYRLSPALVWHFRLLAQLASEYYVAKLHARELQQVGYLRAVHETGARLTHDVKNLLQSLNNLCYLVQGSHPLDDRRIEMLQRQLPQISHRLQQTLAKLQRPESEHGGPVAAASWWASLRQRYLDAPFVFREPTFDADAWLPSALFDSVADNLLQNAASKRRHEGDLQIVVSLTPDASTLSVCDNGSPLRDELARNLFQGPVASEDGLGIGLYHASQQAQANNYQLRLSCNRPGQVCFELSRRIHVAGN